MAQVLEATGLYDLSGSTQVEGELAAYAAGFALVEDALEDLLGELFALPPRGLGWTGGRSSCGGMRSPGRPRPAAGSCWLGWGPTGACTPKRTLRACSPPPVCKAR